MLKGTTMAWNISEEMSHLLNPQVANTFRVLPLGGDRKCVHLVSEASLSQEERERLSREIAFHLGVGAVHIESLAQRSDITAEDFSDQLDRWYGNTVRDYLAPPVSADLMTVLLVAAEAKSAKRLSAQLQQDGFEVTHTKTLRSALRILKKSSRKFSQVLLAGGFGDDTPAVLRQLRAATPGGVVDVTKEGMKLTFPTLAEA